MAKCPPICVHPARNTQPTSAQLSPGAVSVELQSQNSQPLSLHRKAQCPNNLVTSSSVCATNRLVPAHGYIIPKLECRLMATRLLSSLPGFPLEHIMFFGYFGFPVWIFYSRCVDLKIMGALTALVPAWIAVCNARTGFEENTVSFYTIWLLKWGERMTNTSVPLSKETIHLFPFLSLTQPQWVPVLLHCNGFTFMFRHKCCCIYF